MHQKMDYKLSITILLASIFGICWGDKVSYTHSVASATENLLGVNCIADVIYDVEDTFAEFIYKVEVCGEKTLDSLSTIVDDVDELVAITIKIIDYNDKECNNAAYKEDEDAQKKPSLSCKAKLIRQMERLRSYAEETNENISMLENMNSCATMALVDLQLGLRKLPELVNTCGKLAEKVPSN
uniref:Putative dynein heavy chain and region d6 of dynein motor n=2 Tax=Haematobia irritans TaxID=7368 RepID=A0A1L8EBY3_HAEIR